MPYQFNVLGIKVNGISQNGNLEIGPTVQNSHTSNLKLCGVNFSLGDLSATGSQQNTVMLDPDVSDQDQIMNPSMPMVGQV